ncbi:MAG: hypothetical protein C5B59_15030 [Bacteroidetes bacterium]|nr:MAG: hypothetical protein C5B59_15030 [Bacteroidota bacterium]
MISNAKNTIADLIRNTSINAFFNLPVKVMSVEDYFLYYCATYTPQKAVIYPAGFHNEKMPATIQREVSKRFKSLHGRNIPEAFVFQLKNGKVYGMNGAIITEESILLRDVSREFGKRNRHSAFERLSFPKPTYKKGNVAVLITAGGSTYYHWLVDILPRLFLIDRAGVLNDIDYFVLPQIKQRFQEETLDIFGLDRSRLIEVDSNDFCLQAENLFVPSLPSLLGTVNPWAVHFVREHLTSLPMPEVITGDKIYISRKKASSRRLLNEDEIIHFLTNSGFDIIECENYSLKEQAAIFQKAKVIVAPHGSGLTNIMFCNPETVIIEIFSSGFIVPCYWTIANSCSLRYFYAHSADEESEPDAPYWNGRQEDFTFPIKKLEDLFKLSGIQFKPNT